MTCSRCSRPAVCVFESERGEVITRLCAVHLPRGGLYWLDHPHEAPAMETTQTALWWRW